MKKVAIGVIAIGLILGVTGCSTGDQSSNDPQNEVTINSSTMYETKLDLSDGRQVTCAVYARANRGGLSCDWDNAVKQ